MPLLFNAGESLYPLFDFIRKMFSKSSESVEFEPEFQTKPCRSCGRPISYNLEWEHIPNYCRECKKEYQKDTITRTCKRCGKTFSLPSSVQHWPNYCQECRASLHLKRIKAAKNASSRRGRSHINCWRYQEGTASITLFQFQVLAPGIQPVRC